MQVLKLNRQSEGFYEFMGPVFGSRIVEQMTRDRFYDDPGKMWFCIPGQGAASVERETIRNFWATSDEVADALLERLCREYIRLRGIVPHLYEDNFRRMGFHTAAYRKNFMEVHYAAKE